jgi:hypothetical protein
MTKYFASLPKASVAFAVGILATGDSLSKIALDVLGSQVAGVKNLRLSLYTSSCISKSNNLKRCPDCQREKQLEWQRNSMKKLRHNVKLSNK